MTPIPLKCATCGAVGKHHVPGCSRLLEVADDCWGRLQEACCTAGDARDVLALLAIRLDSVEREVAL